MSSGESHELETLKQQVLILQERVRRIEQAFKAHATAGPGASPASPRKPSLYQVSVELEIAKSEARRAALGEYEDQNAIEHFRRCPSVARNIVKNSEMEAAFLRQRGFEPRQSKMEDLARQVVDELGEEEEDEEETETT